MQVWYLDVYTETNKATKSCKEIREYRGWNLWAQLKYGIERFKSEHSKHGNQMGTGTEIKWEHGTCEFCYCFDFL